MNTECGFGCDFRFDKISDKLYARSFDISFFLFLILLFLLLLFVFFFSLFQFCPLFSSFCHSAITSFHCASKWSTRNSCPHGNYSLNFSITFRRANYRVWIACLMNAKTVCLLSFSVSLSFSFFHSLSLSQNAKLRRWRMKRFLKKKNAIAWCDMGWFRDTNLAWGNTHSI